jgi:hypothetical protein
MKEIKGYGDKCKVLNAVEKVKLLCSLDNNFRVLHSGKSNRC